MPSVPQTLGGSGYTLLGLAVVCWLISLLFLFSVAGNQVHGDAALGQAYAWLVAIGFVAATWLWIGGLLLKAGVEDVLPAGGIVLVLYLASIAGIAAAISLLMETATALWPTAIPVLLPAIIIFYVFALYQPSLRPLLSQPVASLSAAALVLLLCAAPLPSIIPRLFRVRQDRAAVQEAVSERTCEENLRKLHAMPADASVFDWLDLLHENSGVRPEALQAVRGIERRQTDIEEMLEAGVPMALSLMPDLDLQATPALCQAAGNYLRKYAKDSRRRPKQDPRPLTGTWVQDSVPALRWLMSHGCDCDATLAAMKASVETFNDDPARQAALATLAELRASDSGKQEVPKK